MKRILTAASAAMLVLCSGSAFAQDDDSDGLNWVPIETFACNFIDGNGPEQFYSVVEEWNEWMDDEGQDDYFAVTLWPQFFGERTFDFVWLGVWPDGNSMGAGLDHWVNNGGEIANKFWEVIDCTSHTQFASARLRDYDSGDDDGSFVLDFSNCKFTADGGGMEAYLGAVEQWNAYADEHGIYHGAWMLIPIYGENLDADYHFKSVGSAPDLAAWGANWQKFSEGHYMKDEELFGNVVDCDSPRLYTVNVEREMADDE